MFFRGLARITVVGGVVYLTVREGIWSDSSQASHVLSKVKLDLVDTSVYRKQVRIICQFFVHVSGIGMGTPVGLRS